MREPAQDNDVSGCLVSGVEARPSPIEGLGLFATRPFALGQRIRRVNVVREVTDERPLREDLGERAEHCDYPDDKVVLVGFPDRHLNHSCDPNVFVLYQRDATYLVARRAIAPGEELTYDYNINTSGGNAWPCHCGSPRCLGTVLGDFFSLPTEQQREYRPYLADWFVRRHAERLTALEETGSPAGSVRGEGSVQNEQGLPSQGDP